MRVELAEVALDALGTFPLMLRRLTRLIRETRVDVVHTHGKGAGLYGRVAARLTGVPSVHTFHGIHYESYSRAGRLVYIALERALARSTHTVINVSTTQDAEARRLGVARPGHSAVVVNGIDVPELDARPALERAALALRADDQVLGCVARFDPVKQHETLVRALPLVAKQHPKAVLLLVGEGPEKERVDRLAAELDVRGVSPGAIGWGANVYSGCDPYVSASSKEGLPLAPLRAMRAGAAGLAVAGPNVPGRRDIVGRDRGLRVPPDAAAPGLAAAIASLLGDPERRRRMGQAGRARVLKEFTLQSMIEKTAAVYRAAA